MTLHETRPAVRTPDRATVTGPKPSDPRDDAGATRDSVPAIRPLGASATLVPRWAKPFRHASMVLSASVIALGVLVVTGWVLDIGFLKSVSPSFVTMKANTALLFVVL